MPCSDPECQAHIQRLTEQLRKERAERGLLENTIRHLRAENAAQDGEIRDLRIDAAQLRAALRDIKSLLQDTLDAMGQLDERFKAMLRRQYGASRERLCADQLLIPEMAEEVDALQSAQKAAAAAAHALEESASTEQASASEADSGTTDSTEVKAKRKRPPNAGGRKPMPDDLPRERSTYTPPDDHPVLRNALHCEQIGTAMIERLHITPIRILVQEVAYPILRLHLAGGIVTQYTCTPPGVIARGQVSDEFLVHSAVDKVQDHLPSYRQEQRFARFGAAVPRSKLCRWHIRLAQFLQALAEAIFDEICASPAIGIDDTVHREVVPNRRICLYGRLWAVASPAGIFYQYHRTRESKWIESLLEDYSGGVMGDAYSGHSGLLARHDILAAFCWAHARRKFYECADKRRRQVILDHIARLYSVEEAIREAPPDERVRVRRERAGPILAQIHDLLQAWDADPHVLPKSGIGNATAYVLSRWDGFKAYLNHGHLPIDNNLTERGMRPNALHRKNSLFSASEKGAEGYATLLTICQSAWMHSLDPSAYMLDVIDRIHHGCLEMAHLTPSAYAAAGKCVVQKRS